MTTLSSSGNSATWSGTGSWNGTSGYAYTIRVADNGSSSSRRPDTIDVTIRDVANQIVFSTGGAHVLKGGNIKVHR